MKYVRMRPNTLEVCCPTRSQVLRRYCWPWKRPLVAGPVVAMYHLSFPWRRRAATQSSGVPSQQEVQVTCRELFPLACLRFAFADKRSEADVCPRTRNVNKKILHFFATNCLF